MFEAYKIGVKISVINHASIGLMALSKDFLKTEASAAKLEARILSIRNQALKGGLMVGLGAAGLSLFKGPLDAAKEYETAYTRFKTLNLGDAVNTQADQFSRGAKAFGASSTQLMDTLRESYGMIGNMDLAKKIAPTIASLNAANSMLFGDKVGKIDANATRSIMRFIDMRGLTDTPEDMMRGLNLAQKMVTGSGGAMKFTDLEQFAKRGGTAFKGMNDEGVMMMATMIQEMGGASAGTGLMSAYQNLVAGRTTKKAMAALQDLGLAQLGEVNHGTVGGKAYKTVQIQGMQDDKTLRENFPLWIMKNVIPAMEKKGITGLPEQAAVVNNLLSNRTGSNLGVGFATQFLQTLRDTKMVKNAMGVDQTINAAKNTAHGNEAELRARARDLYTELGTTVLPLYVRALELTTSAVKGLTGWIERNSGVAKGLMIALGVLSGGLLIRGSVLLLTAAFRGLGGALLMSAIGGWAGIMRFGGILATVGRVLGGVLLTGLRFAGQAVLWLGRALLMNPIGLIITGIAIAAFLVYKYWSPIKTFFIGVWDWVKSLAKRFYEGGQNLVSGLVNGVTAMLTWAKDKIVGFGSNVSGWFKDALGIRSPSRTFMEHGSNIVEGMVLGITRNAGAARKAAAALAAMAIAAANVPVAANAKQPAFSLPKSATVDLALSKPALLLPKQHAVDVSAKSPTFAIPKSASLDLLLKQSPLYLPTQHAINVSAKQPAFSLPKSATVDLHGRLGLNTVAPKQGQPVQVQTSINLDGRKVAEVVSKHQSKELNRPATGGSRFDPTIGVPPVGMNYAK